jgi:hypothetical protein
MRDKGIQGFRTVSRTSILEVVKVILGNISSVYIPLLIS